MENWGLVEGGHDLDRAANKVSDVGPWGRLVLNGSTRSFPVHRYN